MDALYRGPWKLEDAGQAEDDVVGPVECGCTSCQTHNVDRGVALSAVLERRSHLRSALYSRSWQVGCGGARLGRKERRLLPTLKQVFGCLRFRAGVSLAHLQCGRGFS